MRKEARDMVLFFVYALLVVGLVDLYFMGVLLCFFFFFSVFGFWAFEIWNRGKWVFSVVNWVWY